MRKKPRAEVDGLKQLTQLFVENLDVIRPAVRHHARAAVRDLELASDHVPDFEQEAYLELWIKLPLFDCSRGRIATFADRVARNTMINVRKALRAAKRTAAVALPVRQQQPTHKRGQRIWSAVATLSGPDRRLCEILIDHAPAEAMQRSRLSRPSFYRAISRIRNAFCRSGVIPRARGGRQARATKDRS